MSGLNNNQNELSKGVKIQTNADYTHTVPKDKFSYILAWRDFFLLTTFEMLVGKNIFENIKVYMGRGLGRSRINAQVMFFAMLIANCQVDLENYTQLKVTAQGQTK